MTFEGSLGNTSKAYILSLDSLEQMHTFLDAYDLLKLSLEDINHLNRSITSKESEE
jgi:hypothetical protein